MGAGKKKKKRKGAKSSNPTTQPEWGGGGVCHQNPTLIETATWLSPTTGERHHSRHDPRTVPTTRRMMWGRLHLPRTVITKNFKFNLIMSVLISRVRRSLICQERSENLVSSTVSNSENILHSSPWTLTWTRLRIPGISGRDLLFCLENKVLNLKIQNLRSLLSQRLKFHWPQNPWSGRWNGKTTEQEIGDTKMILKYPNWISQNSNDTS